MAQVKFYQDTDGVWIYTDGNTDAEKSAKGNYRRVINGTKISILGESSTFDLFRDVEVTDIQKSGTPDDNYADVAAFKTATTDFFLKALGANGLYHGGMALNDNPVVNLGGIDNYTKIPGDWVAYHSKGFTVDNVLDRIIYSGVDNVDFLFNGSSDVLSDKNATITYGLYKNGVLIPGAETPHDFGTANAVEHIGITAIVTLNKNDYLEIWAKSSTNDTTITPKSLSITFWGSR
jgi:hypothetical protein